MLGVVLGILAGVIWLVGIVLCVTVILLPLGIPVIKLGARLFTLAGDLMPRSLGRPCDRYVDSSESCYGLARRCLASSACCYA